MSTGFENKIVDVEGMKLFPSSADSISRMQSASDTVSRINHTGNPEGVISANPASLSHDPVSGILYLKTSGIGNTGWLPISTSGGGVFTWVNVTGGSPVNMSVNMGYVSNDPASNITFNLPTTAAFGTVLRLTNAQSAFNFTIAQAAGQSIQFGNNITTVGIGGSVSSTMNGDSIELVCIVANLKWQVLSTTGNLTFV